MRLRGRRTRGARGQSTVEFALVLPLVVLMALVVVQVGLVVRDQVLVVHAAREAARAAAVGDSDDQVRRAAQGAGPLDAERLTVQVSRDPDPAGSVRVSLAYRCPTDLPLVGALIPDVDLTAAAVMRQEG